MRTRLAVVSAAILGATSGPCGAEQVVQQGMLSGGKGQQAHPIVLDQFDPATGVLNFVQLDVLTSVAGGGQGDGSGVPVHCFASLAADYFLGPEVLAETEAVIDFVFPNSSPTSFSLFDNDTASTTIDQAPRLAPWIGTGEITLTGRTFFTVTEDPPGIVNFGAGGGAEYAVTYDFTPAAACPADLDGDGQVGTTDLLALLAEWGMSPGGPPDLDGDGVVDTIDFLLLLAAWGPCG